MHNTVAIALMCLYPGIDPGFVSLSTPLEVRYSRGGYRDELFKYRLFAPENPRKQASWPLIVWLHGNCESQRDNVAHLKWLDQFVFRPPWQAGRYPFYLLAVQCPHDNFDWTRCASESQDDMVNVAAAILEKTLSEYPIDRERIYLAGVSSGGSGCWEFGIRYPEYFAAIVPMGSSGGDVARIESLKEIPVWAFHCSRDQDTPIERVRQTVRALHTVGGTVHLTEVDSEKHDCWTAAFDDYHVLEWFLSQRRDQSSPAPGSVPLATRLNDLVSGWKWWQALAQIGIPLALIFAVFNAVRLRRKAKNVYAEQGHESHAEP